MKIKTITLTAILITISAMLIAADTKKETSKLPAYGTFIKCKLSNTIESKKESAIQAITTENVYNQREIVIPQGAEIHGTTEAKNLQNKIEAKNQWTITWKTEDKKIKKELQIIGTAMECTKNTNQDQWTTTDGTTGIPGITKDGNTISEKETTFYIYVNTTHESSEK